MTDEGSSPQAGGPPRRRTVLAGAAWSLPTVVVAAAAPATAASADPTLSFDRPRYAVDGCGTLGGVRVEGTTNGSTPMPAGTEVVITLPSGVSFADGTPSPRTVVMTSPGMVEVPDLVAPISGADMTITATAEGVTASATIVVGPPAGTELYAAYAGWEPQVQPVETVGLPDGATFTSVYAADGQTFVTLADGSIWVSRDGWPTSIRPLNKTWYDTGLTGAVTGAIISGTSREGAALVLMGGVLTSVAPPNSGAAPTISTVPSPPGGAPVQIASSRGVGTFYAETPDGRLWSTPSSGAGSGTWTELTGAPAPVKDWVVRVGPDSEQVHAIGADDTYYFTGNSVSGVRPTAFVEARHESATWIEPAVKFMHSHRDAATTQNGVLFVDADGGLYEYADGVGQNVNFAGVLDGRMGDLTVLNTPEGNYDDQSVHAYVVTGGRLYVADFISTIPMRDVTPPESLLGGATIVDAHESAKAYSGAIMAIDSTGRVFASERLWHAGQNPGWAPASGLPEQSRTEGIVQDGRLTYVLGEPSTCPE